MRPFRPIPPASGGWSYAPQTRAKGQALWNPRLCFRRSLQARQAGAHWGFTSAPNPAVLSRTGHHVRAPTKAVRHSVRELTPRLAANGCFPSSQPGARTIHPSRAVATPPHPTRRHVPCVRRGPRRHAGCLCRGFRAPPAHPRCLTPSTPQGVFASQPPQLRHPDLPRLRGQQVAQAIRRVIAADAVFVGIDFQHVLRSARIVLE